jgi:hypothetical protein
MLALAENCHNFWTLEFGMCGDCITQEALTAIVSNLISVVELNFEESEVGDAVLTAVATHCRQLHTLHLNACLLDDSDDGYTEVGMASLALNCSSLRKLHVDEDDAVLTPMGRLLWSAFQPKVAFDFEFVTSAWCTAIQDIEREAFVIW